MCLSDGQGINATDTQSKGGKLEMYMRNRMIVHKNRLTITDKIARYETYDGYKVEIDISGIKSNEESFEACNELMSFIQEIADTGSEGTFLTERFQDFIVDSIKWATGFFPVIISELY